MPTALHHSGAAIHNEKLYVVGGYYDGWLPSNELLIYDITSDEWSKGENMPTARGALTAEFIDGKLYAVGGFNKNTRYENEVYDPITDSWGKRADIPTPREHHSSAILDGQMYIIGGRDGQVNLDATEVYDYTLDSWKSLEPLPTARSGLAATTLNGVIFVFGGEGYTSTFGENEAYIPDKGWFEQQPMPIPRHGLDAVTVNENIFLIGGGTAPGPSYSSIIEKYHNTIIPEFGFLVLVVFAMSISITILVTKSKFQNKLQL